MENKGILVASYETGKKVIVITSGILARAMCSDEPYTMNYNIHVKPAIKYVGGKHHTFEVDSEFYFEDGSKADVKGQIKLTNDFCVENELTYFFNTKYIKGMEQLGHTLTIN